MIFLWFYVIFGNYLKFSSYLDGVCVALKFSSKQDCKRVPLCFWQFVLKKNREHKTFYRGLFSTMKALNDFFRTYAFFLYNMRIFFIPPPPPSKKVGRFFFSQNPIFYDQKCLVVKIGFGEKKRVNFFWLFLRFWGY